jgi:hypothetical protein
MRSIFFGGVSVAGFYGTGLVLATCDFSLTLKNRIGGHGQRFEQVINRL